MRVHSQEELQNIIKENNDRYKKHLYKGLDSTSVILKGHLFAEELLIEILKLHCRNPQHIEEVQFSFNHKLKLVQAFFGTHLPGFKYSEEVWSVLSSLNQLRNNIAHQIDSPKQNEQLRKFVKSFEQLMKNESYFKLSISDTASLIDNSLATGLSALIFNMLGWLSAIYAIAYLNPPHRIISS